MAIWSARKANEGQIALRRGERDEARALLREALDRDRNNAKAWYLLAFTLSSLEDRKRALRNAVACGDVQGMARQELAYLQSLPEDLSDEDREKLLQRELGKYLDHNWRVEHKERFSVRLVRDRELNTGALVLFSIFYLAKRAGDGPRTLFLEVTADGRIEAY